MKMKQTTFASLAFAAKGKRTRRECFLAEMDAVIPWTQFVGLIEPCYPKAGNGRTPFDCETMLRIYFMQHWFNLSDPAAEDALYDSESMRRFAKLEFIDDALPDETTILRFRHLLEQHRLTERIFAEVRVLLLDQRLLLKGGTIVDATLIAAPASTKNATRTRDPEMTQTKKGNQWHFGMKVHIGTSKQGLVHTLSTTTAATADSTELPKLLHGEEAELYGDRAYWNEQDRIGCREVGMRYRVNRRAKPNRPLNQRQRAVNRSRSRIRARGEHAFRIIKCLWGFTKVRYRGLAKNTARAFAAFALANLYLVRRRLAQPRDSYAP